jgi:hypothetical protein
MALILSARRRIPENPRLATLPFVKAEFAGKVSGDAASQHSENAIQLLFSSFHYFYLPLAHGYLPVTPLTLHLNPISVSFYTA